MVKCYYRDKMQKLWQIAHEGAGDIKWMIKYLPIWRCLTCRKESVRSVTHNKFLSNLPIESAEITDFTEPSLEYFLFVANPSSFWIPSRSCSLSASLLKVPECGCLCSTSRLPNPGAFLESLTEHNSFGRIRVFLKFIEWNSSLVVFKFKNTGIKNIHIFLNLQIKSTRLLF